MSFIPQTYEEWKHCITVKCDITLTQTYIAARLDVRKDRNDFHTEKFIHQWGEAFHAQTVAWFEQAAKELAD